MIRLALVMFLTGLTGCFIVFPEHGSGGGDDDCLLPPVGDGSGGGSGGSGGREEPSQIAPLRNPHTLTCDNFGGGGGTCNPECGPCPLEDQAIPPIPSWGTCFSACEGLDETTCSTRSDCRIIKDAFCAIQGDCFTDFIGCFPTDNFIDSSVDCSTAFDGETCSRNSACTAFHRPEACPLEDPAPPQCNRDFAFCMPEGVGPGLCNEPVTCDAVGPNCLSGTTPGISGGCFTGACIPLDLCELAPN